ncbi:MAG: MFS transporter [Ruminococcaceae bacterium]|nr:MFS transporter [Oscillospiraceae bacterium]
MNSYKSTMKACYAGYFTQAIINNLAPVFFVIFQKDYNITLTQLSWLIFINFGVQIITDLASVYLTDKLGCRKSVMLAHIASTIGLVCLGILPKIMPTPYIGLIIAIAIYAYGSGLIEVLVSPIVEALPTDNKSSAMSLLHSFYCWGQLIVVLFSTLIMKITGTGYWFILPLLWAIVPLINTFNFMRVPFAPMVSETDKIPLKKLLNSKTFIILLLLMLCAGATEMTISQWSSLFAEKGLGVTKVVGDLLGPCLFAFFMGSGRVIYGFFGSRMNLNLCLMCCGILGALCYLLTALSPSPVIALIGCALAGLASSLMWPGFISLAAERYPLAGTALFSLMAVSGDIGCTFGPYIAGIVADFVKNFTSLDKFFNVAPEQAGLKVGILTAVVFPFAVIILLKLLKNKQSQRKMHRPHKTQNRDVKKLRIARKEEK